MLKDEFEFYLNNQESLVKKYLGRFIVIKDKKVVGDFGSREEAYLESLKNYKEGSFLIQHCTPGSASTTQTYHSRAYR